MTRVCGGCGDTFETAYDDVERCFECGQQSNRFLDINFIDNDPFRKAWLSTRTQSAWQTQEREPDPLTPKDRFDAKRVQETHGRIYIGNDVSQLKPKSREAILKHNPTMKGIQ